MSIMATWWHDDNTSWRWQWFLEMAMMMMMTIKHPFAERRRRREIRKSIVWVEVASGGRFKKNTICILLIINTISTFVKTPSSPPVYIWNCERWELFFAKQIDKTDLFVCVTWDCCGCIGDNKIKLYCKDATFQWVKVLLCPKKWLKSIYSGFGHSSKDLFVTWVNWKEHFQKLKMSYLVDVFLAITQLDHLGLSWITLDHLCFTWTAIYWEGNNLLQKFLSIGRQ